MNKSALLSSVSAMPLSPTFPARKGEVIGEVYISGTDVAGNHKEETLPLYEGGAASVEKYCSAVITTVTRFYKNSNIIR